MAYKSLSTANLPDPAINPAQGSSPADYFNTVLYTGNGTGQSITGVGFQPNWTWIKGRSNADYHYLVDSVRGYTERLFSNLTDGASVEAATVASSDSDGFTVGGDAGVNRNLSTYVAWNWKANGSGSTIAAGSIDGTNPTIASQVSANTESGFSIVSYTGDGGASATIGHGLTSAPDILVVKNRDNANAWRVYHSALGNTKYLTLNATDAAGTASSLWNNTSPTSSVFTIGTDNDVNNTNNYIAYCFSDVEGFSKFGSYTGNGNADGPFVYTGFEVKWVMYKRTDSSGDWSILDTERSTYNVADDYLYPHSSAAEASGAYQTDFLSNGFKLRGTNTQNNASGGTYIYMAFAENPFKYSNAR